MVSCVQTGGRSDLVDSLQACGSALKWFAVCRGICDVSRSVGWLCDIEGRVLQDRVLVRTGCWLGQGAG
jgi:hypothetical protein